MEAEKIYPIINNLINLDLKPHIVEQLVDIQNMLSDGATQLLKNTIQETEYDPGRFQTWEGFILSSLGHISLNPNNTSLFELLTENYIYPSERKRSELQKNIANFSEDDATQFIELLCDQSRIEFDYYNNADKIRHNYFWLIGERGIGKTYFINHLLTKFNNNFDEKKIIYIRLNLAEDFGGECPDIIHWLKTKVMYVTFQYYLDKKNNKRDLDNYLFELRDIISSTQIIEVQSKLFANLQDLINQYANRKIKTKITEKSLDPILGTLILDLLIKRGYSFIYIIDNLDKLDNTLKYRKKVSQLYRELNTLLHPDTILGGCILIVSRDETFDYLDNLPNGSWIKAGRQTFFINHVQFTEIAKSRINFLKQYLDKYEKRFGWKKQDWVHHLSQFEEFIVNISAAKHFEDFVSLIDHLYGQNNRAKVHLLQMSYYYFLESLKFKWRYKLIETMVKGGYSLPPKIYHYKLNNKKELYLRNLTKVFDNVFLPIIFSFPYDHEYSWKIKPVAITYLLAPIRVLELVVAYFNKLNNEEQRYMPSEKLLTMLKILYNYDEKIITLILEELSDFGLIKLHSNSGSYADSFSEYLISLRIKTEMIIGNSSLISKLLEEYNSIEEKNPNQKFNILKDVAYLNMCAFRIQLNEASFQAKVPFIRCSLLLKDDQESVTEWTINKIINSISLLRLVRNLYALENDFAVSRIESLNAEDKFIYKLAKKIDFQKVTESITMQLRKIVYDMNPEQRNVLNNILESYIANWE